MESQVATVVELRPVRAAPARGVLHRVTAASQDIEGEADRARARILSVVLLLSVPVGLFGMVMFVVTRETAPPLQVPTMGLTIGLLAVAWWLSRTAHWRVAAGIAIAATLGNGLATAWWALVARLVTLGVRCDVAASLASSSAAALARKSAVARSVPSDFARCPTSLHVRWAGIQTSHSPPSPGSKHPNISFQIRAALRLLAVAH